LRWNSLRVIDVEDKSFEHAWTNLRAMLEAVYSKSARWNQGRLNYEI
jgi:hypothetical protein